MPNLTWLRMLLFLAFKPAAWAKLSKSFNQQEKKKYCKKNVQ
jgi:hypothetical protein